MRRTRKRAKIAAAERLGAWSRDCAPPPRLRGARIIIRDGYDLLTDCRRVLKSVGIHAVVLHGAQQRCWGAGKPQIRCCWVEQTIDHREGRLAAHPGWTAMGGIGDANAAASQYQPPSEQTARHKSD